MYFLTFFPKQKVKVASINLCSSSCSLHVFHFIVLLALYSLFSNFLLYCFLYDFSLRLRMFRIATFIVFHTISEVCTVDSSWIFCYSFQNVCYTVYKILVSCNTKLTFFCQYATVIFTSFFLTQHHLNCHNILSLMSMGPYDFI